MASSKLSSNVNPSSISARPGDLSELIVLPTNPVIECSYGLHLILLVDWSLQSDIRTLFLNHLALSVLIAAGIPLLVKFSVQNLMNNFMKILLHNLTVDRLNQSTATKSYKNLPENDFMGPVKSNRSCWLGVDKSS